MRINKDTVKLVYEAIKNGNVKVASDLYKNKITTQQMAYQLLATASLQYPIYEDDNGKLGAY